jgi:hypothetical protein
VIIPPRFAVPTTGPIVAVFGSSTTRRDDPAWAVADEVGARLAGAGFAVMNGGYQGSMEAVSEGARRAGGEVIGVTTALFNHRPANPHLTHREDTSTLLERLDYLVHVASGFVVLEGSIGTLAELFLAWNLLAVEGRPAAPLLCLGEPWAEFVGALARPGLVVPDMLRFVEVMATPAQVVDRLRGTIAIPAGSD